MDLKMNGAIPSVSRLLSSLSTDSREDLLRRVRIVYNNVKKSHGNLICDDGNAGNEVRLNPELVQQFNYVDLHLICEQMKADLFDILIGFCDFFISDTSNVNAVSVDWSQTCRRFYVSLNEMVDFLIYVMEAENDNEFDVDIIYFIAVMSVLTVVSLTAPDVARDLDKVWNEMSFSPVCKMDFVGILKDAELAVRDLRRTIQEQGDFDERAENDIASDVNDMMAQLNLSKNEFLCTRQELVSELEGSNLGVFNLESIPGLDLVGEKTYENMEVFNKMVEYRLCNHIALDVEKKMNVGRHEKLWVEFDGRFLEGYLHSWVHDQEEDQITHVKVQLRLRVRRIVKEVEAAKVAKAVPVGAMCSAGTRVLARYNRTRGTAVKSSPIWAWGTLGSFPIKEYRFHYLVFFDDGAVAFVRPKNVYICVVQPKAPSTDEFAPVFAYKCVPGIRSSFIKEYFKMYPSWPLMKLERDTSVYVTRELGKKKTSVKAVVVQVDRCLVMVRYQSESDQHADCRCSPCEEDGHCHEDEWIFAGDTMRIPTLKGILSKVKDPYDINQYPEKVRPYIEQLYPKYEVDHSKDDSIGLETFKLKNTARKRSNRDPGFFDFFNNSRNHRLKLETPKEKSPRKRTKEDRLVPEYLDPPDWSHLRKRPHSACSPRCLDQVRAQHFVGKPQFKDAPLFFRPFLAGFQRQLIAYVDSELLEQKSPDLVEEDADFMFVYEAPCGRTLRTPEEVALYLHATNCELASVDQFTFRAWDRPNFVFRSDPDVLVLKDFSHCKEAVSIPVVNSVDLEPEPSMLYQNQRSMDEALLETQMEYVSCCSCTDDCLNFETCECQQLTSETHNRLDRRIRGDIPDGYRLRRLERKLFTGIYECNVTCKCRANCVNKVVQRDISIPMQLFKTEKKGWGVRTLVDVPQGQFVCTYSGKMFTDVKADEHVRQGQGSDMYFADVDLFDSVEGMKRAYNIQPDEDEGIDLGAERKKSKKKRGKKTKWTHVKRQKTPEVDELTLLHKIFGDSRLFVVDAQDRGNLGRFFNHSCDPNMEVQMVFSETHDIRLPVIAFFTSCDVPAGTELCWNYGYVAGSVPGKEIECSCGSPICVGRIL